MIAAAARHGVVLGVGHVEFYNPAVQAVLARDPRPRYLDAQRLSPFTRRSLDIDVVLDLMVHDLQLAQALNAGSAIREIRAVGVPVLSPRVDLANVRLEFENGCVATLTSSRVSAERVRKLRLFEPDCYHSIDYSEQAVSAYRLVHGHDEPRIEPLAIEVAKGEPLAVEHRAFQQACLGTTGSLRRRPRRDRRARRGGRRRRGDRTRRRTVTPAGAPVGGHLTAAGSGIRLLLP